MTQDSEPMNSDWISIGCATAKMEKAPEAEIVTLCSKVVGEALFFSAKKVDGKTELYLSIGEDANGVKYFMYNGNKYIVDIPFHLSHNSVEN